MVETTLDADRIAAASFAKFQDLPKTGKPINGAEWTVLACILRYQTEHDLLDVVALGTGTKCLSGEALSKEGDRLNDSHAEIIARRAFKRFLLEQMLESHLKMNKGNELNDQKTDLFVFDDKKQIFRIPDGITFHFFTTHPPCGDGSIFGDSKESDGEPNSKKPKLESNENNLNSVGVALKTDGFTGGKLIDTENNKSDLMAQDIGAVRTKPGRGIRTLSVSCSDKLSRWSYAGCQGGLLMTLLGQPIYFKTITICGTSDKASIERAIWKRWIGQDEVQSNTFKLHRPLVQQTSNPVVFEHEHTKESQPSPSSLIWCSVKERPFEVSVSGKRQGVTKKKLSTPAGRLRICKREIYQTYLDLVVTECPQINQRLENVLSHTSLYACAKANSTDYRDYFKKLKENCFRCWTQKPGDLHDFQCQ